MPAQKRLDLNGRKIAIAFGGGGIHGAAHAGFLEAFFDKFPQAHIHSMSGTSAGALTATTAAIGFHENGQKGALLALKKIWNGLKNTGLVDHPMNLRSLERLSGIGTLPHWIEMAKTHGRLMEGLFPFWGHLYNQHIQHTFDLEGTFNIASRNLVNPHGKNHLMEFIRKNLDFTSIRSHKIPKLFINAVDCKTKENVIFSNDEINEHTLTASGTLPFLWSPVEYKGRKLVDGKYRANPPILPHLNENPDDIIVVCLGHLSDEPILQQELEQTRKILAEKARKGEQTPRLHVIEIGLEGKVFSKFNTHDGYIDSLISAGKKAFHQWLYGTPARSTNNKLRLSA